MKNRETIEGQALKYLENKYNQEFEVVDSTPSGMDVPYDEITLKTKLHPGKVITVYRRDEGDVSFKDDYFGILKENEYAAVLAEKVGGTFAVNKTYFCFLADYFNDSYTQSTDMLAVMQEDEMALYASVTVFVSGADGYTQDTLEAKCAELSSQLKAANFYVMITVYAVEEDEFTTLNKENYEMFLTNNVSKILCVTNVVK